MYLSLSAYGRHYTLFNDEFDIVVDALAIDQHYEIGGDHAVLLTARSDERVVVMIKRRPEGSKKWKVVRSAGIDTTFDRCLKLDPDLPIDPVSEFAGQLRPLLPGDQPVLVTHDQPEWYWRIEWASDSVHVATDGSSGQWDGVRIDSGRFEGVRYRDRVQTREFTVIGATWAIEYLTTGSKRSFSRMHIGPGAEAQLAAIKEVLATLT